MDIRAAAASGARGLDHRRAVLVPRAGALTSPALARPWVWFRQETNRESRFV